MSDYVRTDEGLIYWPMCAIPGCPNRQCKALQSKYCYPHTPSGTQDTLMKKLRKVPEVIDRVE